MGLLSNPETRSKISDFIGKQANILSLLMFLGGGIWLGALVHPAYNGGVYFSENALLPGMVNLKFDAKGLTQYYESFRAENKAIKSNSDVPVKWIEEQLTALGLEVYTQQYEFTYPMNLLNNKTAHGVNVYGILRAPRTASVESMVLSTPLRPSSSGLTPTDASVALILSMAKHMKKSSYWSKDMIFLFTQHELVGMQAWLDGYLALTTTKYVKAGPLEGRGGLLQAAVNLEFEDLRYGGLTVLTEGVNGQLPNLDLVNVVNKLIRDEGISPMIHNRPDIQTRDGVEMVKYNLITAFTMLVHQATGMASANHGLFLRYRIDAVTIKAETGTQYRIANAGLIIEGVFRSLNNLLEKFHQSFFFYLLPCTYRYISIGLYMPPLALMAAAALIQLHALALWGYFTTAVAGRNNSLKANKDSAFTADGKFTDEALRTIRLPDTILQGIYHILPLVIGCHLAGYMVLKSPDFFGTGDIKQLPAVDAVVLGALACVVACMLLARTVIRKDEFDDLNWMVFKTVILIYHGICLFSLALLNFSLSLVVTVFTVPVYCVIRPRRSKLLTILQALLLIVISPVGIMIITQLLHSLATGEVTLKKLNIVESLLNSQDSLIYALIDHMVYNNYLMYVATMVIYPVWLMMWSLIWMND